MGVHMGNHVRTRDSQLATAHNQLAQAQEENEGLHDRITIAEYDAVKLQKAEQENERLRGENSNLRAELHEPDSPTGRQYQSELTRTKREIERLQGKLQQQGAEMTRAASEAFDKTINTLRATLRNQERVNESTGRLYRAEQVENEKLKAQLAERDVLLRELPDAAVAYITRGQTPNGSIDRGEEKRLRAAIGKAIAVLGSNDVPPQG
jgi:chromosome segregation ATPase